MFPPRIPITRSTSSSILSTMQSSTRLCRCTFRHISMQKHAVYTSQPPGIPITEVNPKNKNVSSLETPLISRPEELRLQDLGNGNVQRPPGPVWSMPPALCWVQGWHGWMLEPWCLVTRGSASSASGTRDGESGLGFRVVRVGKLRLTCRENILDLAV